MSCVIILLILVCSSYFRVVTCTSISTECPPLPIDAARNITGGASELHRELINIKRYASSLRNAIPCYIDGLSEGLHGFASRLRFDDNVSWAAKVAASSLQQTTELHSAINSLTLLERYCPEIPVPRVHGEMGSLVNGSLMYYLTDWVDGTTLEVAPEAISVHLNKTIGAKVLANITLPTGLATQLAEFLFNLTTCPIPERERSSPYHFNSLIESYRLRLPAKRDPSSSHPSSNSCNLG